MMKMLRWFERCLKMLKKRIKYQYFSMDQPGYKTISETVGYVAVTLLTGSKPYLKY